MPGYYLFMTSDDEWRIGSYVFLPQEIIAYEGEQLTLEILGVRGGEHHTVLVGPDDEAITATDGEVLDFVVRRGDLEVIEFVAEDPGLYKLICMSHVPAMTTYIHVLSQ